MSLRFSFSFIFALSLKRTDSPLVLNGRPLTLARNRFHICSPAILWYYKFLLSQVLGDSKKYELRVIADIILKWPFLKKLFCIICRS